MQTNLKKLMFNYGLIIIITVTFTSCEFIDNHFNDKKVEVIEKVEKKEIVAVSKEEIIESVENSHTLTAIFDEEGNVVAQNPTNSDSENESNKNNLTTHKSENQTVKIELKSEKKIGTISVNEKNNNSNQKIVLNESKKAETKKIENREIENEKDDNYRKSVNSIPNF